MQVIADEQKRGALKKDSHEDAFVRREPKHSEPDQANRRPKGLLSSATSIRQWSQQVATRVLHLVVSHMNGVHSVAFETEVAQCMQPHVREEAHVPSKDCRACKLDGEAFWLKHWPAYLMCGNNTQERHASREHQLTECYCTHHYETYYI